MTPHQRWRIEPRDIEHILVRCRCGASLTIPASEREYVPQDCPSCKALWFGRDGADIRWVALLSQALDGLKPRGPESNWHVQLEITPPHEGP